MRQLSGCKAQPSVRENIRGAALSLMMAIQQQYPGIRIDIDTETEDGEDAFLWINIPHGARPEGLTGVVEKLAAQQARRTEFWIVPRIVSGVFRSGPQSRLRPRMFESPRPLVF